MVMDRQLAERMVGAACLLAVLVLVVPAILDGNPDSGATITHPSIGPTAGPSADASAEESLNLRTHTIRLDGPGREPPVPTPRPLNSPPPVSAVPEAKPVTGPPDSRQASAIKPEAPARDAAAAEPMVPVVAAGKGGGSGNWSVQLGSFSQRGNADRLAAELESAGFSASVRGGGGASGTLYRVRAGPATDRTAAEALAARLATAGFKGGRVGRE
jgi:DedD protein